MKSLDSDITKDVIVTFLRDHKSELSEKFGISKIALFGSFARDEQTNDSDIDLLIETNLKTLKSRVELRNFLEEHLGRQVDIGYFNSIRSYVFYCIQEDIIYA